MMLTPWSSPTTRACPSATTWRTPSRRRGRRHSGRGSLPAPAAQRQTCPSTRTPPPGAGHAVQEELWPCGVGCGGVWGRPGRGVPLARPRPGCPQLQLQSPTPTYPTYPTPLQTSTSRTTAPCPAATPTTSSRVLHRILLPAVGTCDFAKARAASLPADAHSAPPPWTLPAATAMARARRACRRACAPTARTAGTATPRRPSGKGPSRRTGASAAALAHAHHLPAQRALCRPLPAAPRWLPPGPLPGTTPNCTQLTHPPPPIS